MLIFVNHMIQIIKRISFVKSFVKLNELTRLTFLLCSIEWRKSSRKRLILRVKNGRHYSTSTMNFFATGTVFPESSFQCLLRNDGKLRLVVYSAGKVAFLRNGERPLTKELKLKDVPRRPVTTSQSREKLLKFL